MAPHNKRNKKKKAFSPLLILLSLLLCAIAYGAMYFKTAPSTSNAPETKEKPVAWYKKQPPAPEMIRLPDAPLILAAKEAEIDTTIKVIQPKRPLKKVAQPTTEVQTARINNVEIVAKPQPPLQAIYEEALPQDVFTPEVIVNTPAVIKPAPETPAAPVVQTLERTTTVKPRWMKYALQMDQAPQANKPMIALVIDDLGLDKRRTRQTTDLMGPMTMAFIPYSTDLARQTQKAKQQGHELLLHLPMEPTNPKIDAGPNHLHTHLAKEDLLERIHWNLERFDGYVGVNNHMGSLATTDETVMSALIEELRKREMIFLDSRTNAKSVGAKIAQREGVPFVERNVFLDNVNEKGAVLKQLATLERVARKTGYGVGIGHPRDGTIAALKEWLPSVQEKGLVLVPISQIILKKQST
jgi:polysaccharide deacetylase 2 family uncharacterized protein YibQ